MKEDHRSIMNAKREWDNSRNEEDKVSESDAHHIADLTQMQIQNQMVDTMEERSDSQAAAKARIDERNKVNRGHTC